MPSSALDTRRQNALRQPDDRASTPSASTLPPSASGLVTGHILAQGVGGTLVVTPGAMRLRSLAPLHKMPRGAPRGVIRGLSRGAQARLTEVLTRVDFGKHPASFISLTYHFGASGESLGWHENLHHFITRLSREWPSHYLGGTWVLEFQRRGVPHFHLIVFWRREVDTLQLRRWVAREWNAIAEPGDVQALRAGTSADPVVLHQRGGAGRLMRYLAKYIGKSAQKRLIDEETGELLKTGRMWGTFGDLPQTVLAIFSLDPSSRIAICKILRRWGKHSRYLKQLGKRYPGGLIFGDPASLLQLMRGIPSVCLYAACAQEGQGPAP